MTQREKEAWNKITAIAPIPLGELCNWGPTQTLNLNLQKSDWCNHFCTEEGFTNFYNFSGLYVFWWLGDKEVLKNSCKSHLLMGKRYKAVNDDRRYADANVPLPNIFTSDAGLEYLLQPVDYQFKFIDDASGERAALYAGKASGVFDRVKAHLVWKDSFANFHHDTPDDFSPRLLPGHGGQQQLRAGFEYLFQEEDEETRKNYLYNHVGITLHPSLPNDVSFRFYMEDYLIGTLAAAFNVDTER